jgi:hypothetical protein
MTEMECFGKLTYKGRNYLATMRENLVAMDESANLSKQERSWEEWKQTARALRRSVPKLRAEDDGLRVASRLTTRQNQLLLGRKLQRPLTPN